MEKRCRAAEGGTHAQPFFKGGVPPPLPRDPKAASKSEAPGRKRVCRGGALLSSLRLRDSRGNSCAAQTPLSAIWGSAVNPRGAQKVTPEKGLKAPQGDIPAWPLQVYSGGGPSAPRPGRPSPGGRPILRVNRGRRKAGRGRARQGLLSGSSASSSPGGAGGKRVPSSASSPRSPASLAVLAERPPLARGVPGRSPGEPRLRRPSGRAPRPLIRALSGTQARPPPASSQQRSWGRADACRWAGRPVSGRRRRSTWPW